MEKAWLSQQGVAFTERDIFQDATALQELEALDIYSTPATLVDGELVVGFNRKKLEALLGLAKAE